MLVLDFIKDDFTNAKKPVIKDVEAVGGSLGVVQNLRIVKGGSVLPPAG